MSEEKTDPKIQAGLENLRQAFAKLKAFLDEPIRSERDKAGVIQAFEFTFELFWKTFQKVAGAQGLGADSPMRSLQAAFQLRLIREEDDPVWISMLKDRNATSHIYDSDLAEAIFLRIRDGYFPAMDEALRRLHSLP